MCSARTLSKANLSQGLIYVSLIIGICNEDICAILKMFVEVVSLALCTLDLLQHGTTILILNSPL